MDVGGLLYRFATEGWPAKMAGGIVDAVKLPGQVAGGLLETKPAKPGVWSDEDEARSQLTQQGIYDRATDMAGLVMGGGYGAAQPGAVGIFGGRLAKTADQAALSRAEDMAAKGASREQIWNDTGWFQGGDKKWRFEIPDNVTHFKGTGSVDDLTRSRGDGVGDVFHHPELFNAYPDAAGIELSSGRQNAYMGSGEVGGGSLISLKSPDRSVMLHELQHGIQHQEGFAQGANNIGLRKGTPAWDIYKERLAAINNPMSHELFSKAANYDGMAPLKDYQVYLKTVAKPPAYIDRAAQEYAVNTAYKRTAGEVESRNVQTRMDMTPEQRRASPPWATQDVPDNMQIIRMLGLSAP